MPPLACHGGDLFTLPGKVTENMQLCSAVASIEHCWHSECVKVEYMNMFFNEVCISDV